MPEKTYLASWSGGKDSCFAVYQALAQGYKVSRLVNFISQEYQRVRFHGTEKRMIQLQAQAIGIPVFQKETTAGGYEAEFKEAVRALLPEGIEGMVFGDIYLDEHKEWVERVCAELGIEAVEPLWGRSTESILTGFIDAGFEAVVVGAQADKIDQEWLGRRVDRDFMNYLKSGNIDLCGENGEYHTLVINGPLFQRRLEIIESRTIRRDRHWMLDTVSYQIV